MTSGLLRTVAKAAVVLALALGVLAPRAHAQREEDAAFKAAIEARKRSRWREVADQMQQAIQADPKESTRKVGRNFIGAGGVEYLPYYFLGEAYFKLNDCGRAVVAWATSEQQGVVRGRSEYYGDLRKGYEACAAAGILLPGRFEPTLERSTRQLSDVTALATRVKSLGDANLDVWRSNPGFDAQYKRAAGEHQAARKQLESARQSRLERDFTQVTQAAERAGDLFRTLEAELTRAVERGGALMSDARDIKALVSTALKLDEQIESRGRYLTPALVAQRLDGRKKLESARDQLAARAPTEASVAAARAAATSGREDLEQVFRTVEGLEKRELKQRLDVAQAAAAETFLKVTNEFQTIQSLMDSKRTPVGADLLARRDTAVKQFEVLKRRLGNAVRNQQPRDIDTAREQAEQMLGDLRALESVFGPVTLVDRGVPQWLQSGATLFFQGDYARALDVLDAGDPGSTTVPQHLHLLRAAANHALYVRSGERDTARLEKAIAEVKRCKAIDAAFSPDRAAFSPRFIEFYQADGAASPSAADRDRR